VGEIKSQINFKVASLNLRLRKRVGPPTSYVKVKLSWET